MIASGEAKSRKINSPEAILMNPSRNLRAGIFLAPFHPVDEDPTLCIQRDLELIEHLDRLGYDEAWIGEHHSAGFEIIARPELFIAAAAERTKRIMLGTGVISLPYHNPLMAAEPHHPARSPDPRPRDVRRRPGPAPVRRDFDGHRSRDAARPHGRIDRGDPAADGGRDASPQDRDWFTLNDATLQLRPYTRPQPADRRRQRDHADRRQARRHATASACCAWRDTQAGGYDALDLNWKIANDAAAENGRKMDRRKLRLVGAVPYRRDARARRSRM